MMGGLSSFLGLLLVGLCTLATAQSNTFLSKPPCRDFFFNVSTVSFNDTGVIQPAASYCISATHCPPSAIIRKHSSSVQLLLHGGTLNKLYWSALAHVGSMSQIQLDNYSYVDFARREGYHTIAIDRLGAGNSSHPDPTLVRAGLETELINTIIQQIRRRLVPHLPLCEKLILVGHSYGSFIGSILLDRYPEAVDATILTGFVHVPSSTVATVGPQMQMAAASTVFPSKFGNLDPWYLTLSNETNQREVFYGADGTFDPEVADVQYKREDAQAIGEINSITDLLAGSYSTDLSTYAGPLALMIGKDDQSYCQGDCGTGNSSLVAMSQSFWPNVSMYTGFILENTGHLLQYHYTARQGFQLLHDWLERNDRRSVD